MIYTKYASVKFVFASLVMLSLWGTACSDGEQNASTASDNSKAPANASSSKEREACQLLMAADAEEILGHAVTQSMNTSSMCQYVTTAEELSHVGESVTVNLMSGAASSFDSYVKSSAEQLNVSTEPVTGIGDKAAWAEGTLILAKGSDLLTIMIGKRMEKEPHLTATKNLAQKVLSRM